jgi:AcrR family transcriptional regulator
MDNVNRDPTLGSEDPRVTRSKCAIIETTRTLLREKGFAGTSIEAISARSGVAKTTIYRHWPDSNLLLLDAFAFDTERPLFAPTDDLRADLCEGLGMLVRHLGGDEWAPLTPAMIEAAERDLAFRKLSKRFMEERRHPLSRRLTVAVQRNELPTGTDVELVASMLAGPLFYRRLVSRQIIAKGFVEALVDTVLFGAAGGRRHDNR